MTKSETTSKRTMSTTVQGRMCFRCGYYKRENKNRGWCYWLGIYINARSYECNEGYKEKEA